MFNAFLMKIKMLHLEKIATSGDWCEEHVLINLQILRQNLQISSTITSHFFHPSYLPFTLHLP